MGKEGIIKRIKEQWPSGADRLISKVKASEASEFLGTYSGASRHRQALEVLRSMFSMAIKDGMIARSPVKA